EPGIRRHATTVFLCTSRPAQRAYTISMAAAFPEGAGRLSGKNFLMRDHSETPLRRHDGVPRNAPGQVPRRALSAPRTRTTSAPLTRKGYGVSVGRGVAMGTCWVPRRPRGA